MKRLARLLMDNNTAHFYNEGFESKQNELNPYNRKTQILPFHAWQAGHYDKHGKLARSENG
jgi:hypothetical protein